jgi:Domain of unknown function (DUF2019)
MKHARLEDMTLDQLVDRFAEIGIAQDQAELMGEIRKFNKLFDQMHAVDIELRARSTQARLALLRLFDHENTTRQRRDIRFITSSSKRRRTMMASAQRNTIRVIISC